MQSICNQNAIYMAFYFNYNIFKSDKGAEFMKMTFRWYGEKDGIPLRYIGQIPNMSGVVTAVYDTPVGERCATARGWKWK